MKKLFLYLLAGTAGFYLAVRFVPGVDFIGEIKYLIMAGCFLGLINFFIKPIIKATLLPLTILTLGLFGIIINIAIIWFVSLAFPELIINGFFPLFWTSLVVWLANFLLGLKK
jgi:putative membrane protein